MQVVFFILLVKEKSLGSRVLQENAGSTAGAEAEHFLPREWDRL